MVKRCVLVLDLPQGLMRRELTLPEEADIAAALRLARQQLPELAVDWEQVPVGIYGRSELRTAVPQDGDRIEVYRTLVVNPRANRRARAALNKLKR